MRKTNKEFKADVMSGDLNRIKSAITEYAVLNKCDVDKAAMELRKMAREEGREDLANLVDEASEKVHKRGCITAVIVAVILGVLCVWGISKCDTTRDRTKVENAKDGSVWQVKEVLKNNLKDRSSYEPISWGDVERTSDGGYTVTHTYRAKNSFGGYTVTTVIAKINREGYVVGIVE